MILIRVELEILNECPKVERMLVSKVSLRERMKRFKLKHWSSPH